MPWPSSNIIRRQFIANSLLLSARFRYISTHLHTLDSEEQLVEFSNHEVCILLIASLVIALVLMPKFIFFEGGLPYVVITTS